MDILFLCVVIFLFLLAVFDLSVGVSNDAVNFLNSAIGSKAASFKRILIVASIGVFIGAAMSNGMMDIARHGIFRPEHFAFYDLICIFMAVMVTDIILLDVFNTLGMPTSTTVSMVFGLLGATFAVAMIKMAGGSELGFNDLLNTEKALSVILGIFLSVAVAFFFGTVVQFISRMIFSFNYRSHMKWKIGIFGGICATAIVYFLLLKGVKEMVFMTPEAKAWIGANTWLILGGSLVLFTVVMQLLHMLKVNVLKVIVMMGTFALAMAFAGNDLVNFIGVPLSGLESYNDYMANGAGDAHGFLMGSLNGPSDTPVWFLIGAGVIMVVSLATSKKTHNVSKTEIGLGSQQGGEELFGSSRIARRLVRWALRVIAWVRSVTPPHVRRWFNRRFNTDETIMDQGAAFDLIRGAVNLVLAGALIALGTSLKLPLSTTFVTFMVAMGTSLADRAWGRESAVFRITGVISVIGGWFVTAGVAFIGAGMVVCLMHLGGIPVMIAGGVTALAVLIRSNIRFRSKEKKSESDALFQTILSTEDRQAVWPLLRIYINEKQKMFLNFAASAYDEVTSGFMNNNIKLLSRSEKSLVMEKDVLKGQRRRLTLCLRRVSPETAIEKSTWFHLSNNMSMSMTYNLRRINEVCKEHVDNNFRPLPERFYKSLLDIRGGILDVMRESAAAVDDDNPEVIDLLRRRCEAIKRELTAHSRDVYEYMHSGDVGHLTVNFVYLNLLQESQELVSSLRKMLRAIGKLNLAPSCYRSFTRISSPEI